MEEIYRIGDRVTVLKDGSYVGTWALSEINTQQLIVKMVGRELHDVYPSKQRPVGKELLRVENLTTEKIKGVSFSLRRGRGRRTCGSGRLRSNGGFARDICGGQAVPWQGRSGG